MSRAATHAYLAARGLRAVRDRSNDDEGHLRNVVRRRVLPALERELTPAIGLRLARLARELRVEAYLAEQTIERLLAEAQHAELPLALLERAGPGAPRLLHAWISRFGVRPSARQVEAILGVARSADPGGRADLGRGVLVRRAYGALLLERDPVPGSIAAAYWGAVTLPIPGEARFPGGWRLTGELAKADVPQVIESPGEAAPWQLDVDPSRVGDSVVLRAPRAGDRIRLPGGRRKLSDVLIDARVPRAERRSLVVVEGDEEILWIPGVVASVVAAAPERSGARVHLRAEREVCRHFSRVITTREPGL